MKKKQYLQLLGVLLLTLGVYGVYTYPVLLEPTTLIGRPDSWGDTGTFYWNTYVLRENLSTGGSLIRTD
ncbi:MAG: hypothetical protein ACK5XP_11630, partial [Sphingobacteriia bacterium]